MVILTARQSAVLRFISTSIVEKGYPPTFREIGAQLGIRSPNGVCAHLKALEKKGAIVRDPDSARAIRVPGIEPAEKVKRGRWTLPLRGKVS
jgi:repressor LexA